MTGLSFWPEPAGSRLAGVMEPLLISLVTPLLPCFKVTMSAMNKRPLMLHGAEVMRGFSVGTHAGPEPEPSPLNVVRGLIPSRLEMTANGLFPPAADCSLLSRLSITASREGSA